MRHLPVFKPYKLPFVPGLVALVFVPLADAITPAPTGTVSQGLTSACAALMGYGIGALLEWVIDAKPASYAGEGRWHHCRGPQPDHGDSLHLWQQSQRDLIGMDHAALVDIPLWIIVAAIVFALLLVISRATVNASFLPSETS